MCGDRSWLTSTGPITFAPGDSQEVIIAMVIGQGDDHLDSITQMRQACRAAFVFYENGFGKANLQPPLPHVLVSGEDHRIALSWDASAESCERIMYAGPYPEAQPIHYRFEGYNIYQLSNDKLASATQITRIATVDLVNEITDIWDMRYLPETQEFVEHVVQPGANTGLQRFWFLRQDAISGGMIVPGREYTFAVTSYAVDPTTSGGFGLPKVQESEIRPIKVVPHTPLAGMVYSADMGDTLVAEHRQGNSAGKVYAVVLHREACTGQTYRVQFDSLDGSLAWRLWRSDTLVIDAWRNQSGNGDYPVLDGLLLKVEDDPHQLNSIDDVFELTAPWVIASDRDAALAEIAKINVFPNPLYPVDNIGAGSGDFYVTFSHLPERATIRIYSLSGDLVRILEHNDTSTFHRWDLLNAAARPAASGVYLVYISMPDWGVTKVLKLAVFVAE